jgi:hypothetical protein
MSGNRRKRRVSGKRTVFEAMMQSNADIQYCLDHFEEQRVEENEKLGR